MAAQLRRSSRQVERKRKLGLTSEEEEADLKPAAAAVERGAGPLPPLTDLMLTSPLLLRTHVVPLLTPIDLVRASHVSKEHRRFFSSDEVWAGLLQEIGHHYKTELTETGILAFLNKTFMHAYMAATTHRCHTCGKWTQKVEVLKLQPVCWKCFKETADTEVMVKSKAVQQYLLTPAEASRLPCLTLGDPSQPLGAVKLVLRAHAEQLATQRYPDGMAGLLRDKAERRAAAEARHAKKMQAYHAKRADAQRQGLPLPKYPKSSPLLSGAIDVKDGGACARSDDFIQYLLVGVGYLRRADPTKSLSCEVRPGEYLVCVRCEEHQSMPAYKRETFPSSAAAAAHLDNCPYFDGYNSYDEYEAMYHEDGYGSMDEIVAAYLLG